MRAFLVIPAPRLPARQALGINFSQGLKAGISGVSCGNLLSPSPEIPASAGMTHKALYA